jgi:Amt family ammonium transporter
MALALIGMVSTGRADTPATAPAATEPATQPAAAVVADPSGATGAGNSLLTPNPWLPGWTPATVDEKTKAPTPKTSKLTDEDHVQLHARGYYAINFTWTLICGFLVMFMQAGFALVETGLIRAKNAAHTMSMNFMVYALGMFGFFVCGFAFMCGGANGTNIGGPGQLGGVPTLDSMFAIGSAVTYNGATDHGWGLIGLKGFFLTGPAYDGAVVVWFLFMMVFMDTTATIVTGACAERWSFKSFFIFSIFVGAITYPIFGCWVWGGGWLAQTGYRWGLGHGACDYAGSGVVHLQGGALAFITAYLIGPRLGKYDKNGKIVNPIVPHDIPMVQLGTFILAFGWFGFNPGSSLAAMDGRIGVIAVNTMLAGMSATLSSTLFMWWFGPTKKPDPAMMCNGLLAGLVAITAPCAFVSPVGAFTIGAVAGVLVCLSVFFFDKIRIDDPVGAISVHGANGLWGVLAVGLFADGTYGAGYNAIWDSNVTGLFYGGGVKQLAAQAIEVVACIGWNVIVGGLIFFCIGKILGSNRVPAEVEIAGLDMPEMGALGYPDFALTGQSGPEATSVSVSSGARREPLVPA